MNKNITTAQVLELAQKLAPQSDLYIIDVTVSPAQDIEITVDATDRVSLQQCADLSKALEPLIDPEIDFSLSVFSAGIGQPIKDHRQLDKLIGKPIEIILKTGEKRRATLTANDTQNNPTLSGNITIQHTEKQPDPTGKKKKIDVTISQKLDVTLTKSIIELLDIK